jgi:hypothetical protein
LRLGLAVRCGDVPGRPVLKNDMARVPVQISDKARFTRDGRQLNDGHLTLFAFPI